MLYDVTFLGCYFLYWFFGSYILFEYCLFIIASNFFLGVLYVSFPTWGLARKTSTILLGIATPQKDVFPRSAETFRRIFWGLPMDVTGKGMPKRCARGWIQPGLRACRLWPGAHGGFTWRFLVFFFFKETFYCLIEWETLLTNCSNLF